MGRFSDFLKWFDAFGVDNYDCIVGNPPYVNPHDLDSSTAQFLKENFITTKDGVFNIFYAFIEYAIKYLHDSSKLCFIVPNNFLTIKTAKSLRRFLIERKCFRKLNHIRNINCLLLVILFFYF